MRLLSIFTIFGFFAPLRADTADFVASDAKLEKLWGEGEFTEGPCLGPDGCIYFSDIGNRIMKFDPETKMTTVFRDPSGRANGLKFDLQGRLIACEGANTGGKRRITSTLIERGGTLRTTTLADKYMGKMLNSPNDLAIDAKGRIYFSDPRYVGNEKRELEDECVYRLDRDGTVRRLITDVSKPNGIVISPDQRTLYLAESHVPPNGVRELRAYPLYRDGTVGPGKVLYNFGTDRGIDGMATSAGGWIFAAAGKGKTAGITFFSPEGKKEGFLPLPEDPSNCCFGGKDMKMLYITAGKSLYRIPTKIAGGDARVEPKE
jgi:gluconolactonase